MLQFDRVVICEIEVDGVTMSAGGSIDLFSNSPKDASGIFSNPATPSASVNTYRDIKINADIDKTMGGDFDSATITLTGMALKDIEAISTNYRADTKRLKENFIRITAGYPENYAIIFSGSIINAEPDVSKADMELRIEATTAYLTNVKAMLTISLNATTLQAVCSELASVLDVSLKYRILPLQLGDFAFQGLPFGLLEQLRKAYPKYKFILNSDSLEVVDISKPSGGILTLNTSSGLIGSPIPTFTGAEVTSLLIPNMKANDNFNLICDKLPALNGLYRARAFSHHVSNRDLDFFTKITADKVGRFGV